MNLNISNSPKHFLILPFSTLSSVLLLESLLLAQGLSICALENNPPHIAVNSLQWAEKTSSTVRVSWKKVKIKSGQN